MVVNVGDWNDDLYLLVEMRESNKDFITQDAGSTVLCMCTRTDHAVNFKSAFPISTCSIAIRLIRTVLPNTKYQILLESDNIIHLVKGYTAIVFISDINDLLCVSSDLQTPDTTRTCFGT